jgi:hypothetical protein
MSDLDSTMAWINDREVTRNLAVGFWSLSRKAEEGCMQAAATLKWGTLDFGDANAFVAKICAAQGVYRRGCLVIPVRSGYRSEA